ncbi:MAG: CBS domain-containing protein [Pirellulales bacterium]
MVTIPAAATVLDACEFLLLHKLLAFPVVDEERRMLGIVDVDLYTEELADVDRRAELDNLFQLFGVHFEDSQARSPVAAFKSRLPWLLANIAGGIVAEFLSGLFQAELEKAVAIALFVPVVLALAESVAIQSVSIALQRLHGRRPSLAAITRAVRHESATGPVALAATDMVTLVIYFSLARQLLG